MFNQETATRFDQEIEGLAMSYFKTALETAFEEDPDLDYQILAYRMDNYSIGTKYLCEKKSLVGTEQDLLKSIGSWASFRYQPQWREVSGIFHSILIALQRAVKKMSGKKLGVNNSARQYNLFYLAVDRKLNCYLCPPTKEKQLVEIKGMFK
jgi:hypothetical protein